MRNVLSAAVVFLTANACWAEDAPKASGALDGKKVKFPEKSVADGVKATVGLLESCHSEGLYQVLTQRTRLGPFSELDTHDPSSRKLRIFFRRAPALVPYA
jgi:hypothetical protein